MAHDVIIHGGGIHGVATALDCALRGLKVLLVDKYDFGYGASTNNSKLIHGGLRYLEQYDFALVRESLQERSWLLRHAPEYVKPLPFLMPIYKGQKPPSWLLRTGLFLYDLLALGGNPLPPHNKLDREETLSAYPELSQEGLQGAFRFYDCQMDDRRILFAMLSEAIRLGVEARNWCENPPDAEAEVHFYALGAYSDESNVDLMRTKGVHLLLPPLSHKGALLLRAPQDGRVFFVIPWKGMTLLGTTDTPFLKTPEECRTEQEDICYLMDAFFHYFPSKKQKYAPIGTFSGLRPLIREENKKPSDLSRRHLLLCRDNRIALIGGKYTTFRRAAMQATDLIEQTLGRHKSRSGLHDWTFPPFQAPTLAKAIQQEKVLHLEDWYFRRTEIGLTQGLVDYEERCREFQNIMGLSNGAMEKEKERCYKQLLQNRLA